MKIKATLALACLALAAGAASATDLVIATVNNGHMIEMQKLTPHFEKANPGHQAQVGHARGRHAAPARDDRHRHQGRPVRRDDDRHVRDADLGQEGLAQRAQARRRLRRRRPAAGDAQRPVGRRQALRRAVLRRELDADVPQGPDRQGRHHVRRAPDLGPGARRRRQDPRPEGRRVRHLPARQAGLGRQHGLPHDDGQQLRRPVVRHELEAAAREQALERRDHLLRRPAEEVRPARLVARTASTRSSRSTTKASAACGSTRRSPPRSSPTRSRARWPTRWPSRRARTAPRPKGANWLWAWALAIPAGTKNADAAQKFITWATSKDYINLVAKEKGWAAVPTGTRKSTYANPEFLKAAKFAEAEKKAIDSANPNDSTLAEEPVRRRAVRGDPRVPGDRHRGGPADERGAGGQGHGRPGAEGIADRGRARDEARAATTSRAPPAAARRLRAMLAVRRRCVRAASAARDAAGRFRADGPRLHSCEALP